MLAGHEKTVREVDVASEPEPLITLPAEIAQIACWNKKADYGLLFKASAETVMTIAADPKRRGAKLGLTISHWGTGALLQNSAGEEFTSGIHAVRRTP